MTFRDKLLALLDRRKLSLGDLAGQTGILYDTLRNYAKPGSDRLPSAANGIALARALAVSPEWLFDETQGLPPPELTGPPWRVVPWPPDGIDWETIHLLVARHAIEQELHTARRLLNRIGRLQRAGNQVGADAASDDFRKSMDRYAAILTAAPIAVRTDGNLENLCHEFEELPPRFFALLRDHKEPKK